MAVTVCLPLITVLVALFGTWHKVILEKQKSAIESSQAVLERRSKEQVFAFQTAEAQRQATWQKYLDDRKETKEQTELAMKLTEGLSLDNPQQSIKSLLLALCFVKSRHIDPQIVDVLIFHNPDDSGFRNELRRALEHMKTGFRDVDQYAEAIKTIDRALTSVSPGATVRAADEKDKADTVQTALDKPQAISIGGAADVAATVRTDSALKGNEQLSNSADMVLDTVLQRVESKVEQPTAPLMETIRATLDPAIAGDETVSGKLESASRDTTKVSATARVAAVDQALEGRNRFVIVYGKNEDKERAVKLAEWARDQNFVVAVWDVRAIDRKPTPPPKLEFRHCKTTEATSYAEKLLPKLNDVLKSNGYEVIAKPKGLPHSVIAFNEYEIWFPW